MVKFSNSGQNPGTLREKRFRKILTISRSWSHKQAGAEYHMEAALLGEGESVRDRRSKYSCMSWENAFVGEDSKG